MCSNESQWHIEKQHKRSDSRKKLKIALLIIAFRGIITDFQTNIIKILLKE